MDECIFCKIASKKMASDIVFENEKFIAFLDVNPAAKGHALVMPKRHSTDFLDMGKPEVDGLMETAQKVARAVKKAFNADGVNVIMNNGKAAGQVIFHPHLHVVPRFHEDGLSFKLPREKYAEGEAKKVAEKIAQAVD
jgi:histidine triad (HIT) family protein